MKDEPKTPMTPDAAARIQSAAARASSGKVPSGSFAARAQSAAAIEPDDDDSSTGEGDPGSTDSCDD
jgi:hypothetical protein